ncbi:MiaA tRNA delta(2)-isopentenylpyrophosphate transferase [Rhabdaerophilaceae bacterium]
MAFATLIAGPTASGKSALAIEIAERCGAEVVNADSMQVYADLAILSARPNREDIDRVPHRLFGFVPSQTEYSVGHYVRDIAPLLSAARSSKRPLVIVGGTGLYFRALVEGLMPAPSILPRVRAEWRDRAQTGEDLHRALLARDPVRARELHPNDHPRLLRAIEVFESTGRAYSAWRAENPGEALLARGEWRGVFLSPDRVTLGGRIAARFERMMEDGALAEVSALLGHSPPLAANLGVMKAHGMPHLAALLRRQIGPDEAISRSIQDTRAYARRQVMFARRYLAEPDWAWCSTQDEARELLRQP